MSGAISECLCDLDMVSRGDVVVRVGDMPLSGCGDTDARGVDTVVSGAVSECLCHFDSVSRGDVVVRVGEISLSEDGDADMCGRYSIVTDETGDWSGVEVVDDVVAYGDDTLLHDAVRVSGWLSLV